MKSRLKWTRTCILATTDTCLGTNMTWPSWTGDVFLQLRVFLQLLSQVYSFKVTQCLFGFCYLLWAFKYYFRFYFLVVKNKQCVYLLCVCVWERESDISRWMDCWIKWFYCDPSFIWDQTHSFVPQEEISIIWVRILYYGAITLYCKLLRMYWRLYVMFKYWCRHKVYSIRSVILTFCPILICTVSESGRCVQNVVVH